MTSETKQRSLTPTLGEVARDAADVKRGRGQDVELVGVTKRYGGIAAVDGVDLRIEAGEFRTLLGPSGSGKTTVLMLVAGFLEADAGQILVGGRDFARTRPEKRPFGIVFQSYALFPHMSVRKNVEFPLRIRNKKAGERREAALAMLDQVGLTGFSERMPHELSGGQQQRVAVARALVYEPSVLLMDEPLSALDKSLRKDMQTELKALHREFKTTVIYVTHDQEEALALSDSVTVMRGGKVEQTSDERSIYYRPRTSFVAGFIGESTLFSGTVGQTGGRWFLTSDGGAELRLAPASALVEGKRAEMIVRPESVKLRATGREDDQGQVTGTVEDKLFLGDTIRYVVGLDSGERLISKMAVHGELELELGQRVVGDWSVEELIEVRDDG